MRDMLLILNFDNAASTAIARALRAEQIYCKIVPPDITEAQVEAQQPVGLILSGGDAGSIPPGIDPPLLKGTWPVLALGSAAAMLCRQMGGDTLETVFGGGIGTVEFVPGALTEGLDRCERMLRGVRRFRLPAEARPLATCMEETIGFMHHVLPVYGVQFSLEPNDTDGIKLLLNFALLVCGASRWWSYEIHIERAVEELRRMVGDGQAVCAITGGLNSGVTATLAHQALGDQLRCIFIDTGLLRERETARVLGYYRDQLGLRVTHVQAEERFLNRLQGVTDQAEKNRVIGEELQAVLDQELAGIGEYAVILRSTTATDLLKGEDAAHRPGLRGEAPVAEPLRELFKDEVRRVAECLGMPQEIIRMPSFPGSGLALRILGEVNTSRLQTLRAAHQTFAEAVGEAGLDRKLRHYFAVLAPMPGDEHQAVIVLRAVQAGNASSTAYAARLPFDLMEQVTERILRERPEVRRVVYDLSPSAGGSGVEWI